MKLTKDQVTRLNYWVAFFRSEYEGEVPMQIHARVGGSEEGGGLGGPPFHPRFVAWLTASMAKPDEKRGWYKNQHGHNRVTKVLRLIREVSPREYFVLQRIINDHLTIEQTVDVMNARSESLGHDEKWDYETVLALLLAGLDKASKWY